MVAAAPARVGPKPLAWLVPAVVAGSALPAVAIAARAAMGALGANPISEALNELGLLALALLLLSLACTPVRVLTGLAWPIRVQRALGLAAFAYAAAHLSVYVVLDQGLALRALVDDVLERPFIFVGFAALVLLTPLAITSTAGWTKRLGAARWRRLQARVRVRRARRDPLRAAREEGRDRAGGLRRGPRGAVRRARRRVGARAPSAVGALELLQGGVAWSRASRRAGA